MKGKMVYGVLFLFFVVLAGAPMLYAGEEVEEVYSQDDTGESDPSEFEGDSESMPGERAPEYLPMDDAPAAAGLGIE